MLKNNMYLGVRRIFSSVENFIFFHADSQGLELFASSVFSDLCYKYLGIGIQGKKIILDCLIYPGHIHKTRHCTQFLN